MYVESRPRLTHISSDLWTSIVSFASGRDHAGSGCTQSHKGGRPHFESARRENVAYCRAALNDTFEFVAITVTVDDVVLPEASEVTTRIV